MATPQELWVFDESLLSQLLVEKLVHIPFQTIPKLCSPTQTSTHIEIIQTSHAWSLEHGSNICHCVPTHILLFIIVYLLIYLNVQGREVAVEVLWVVDVRLCADGTHHVSDVLVPHCYGEMLFETSTAHRALARRQGLHLRHKTTIQLKFSHLNGFIFKSDYLLDQTMYNKS